MPEARLFRARYLLPIGRPAIEDGALLVQAGRLAAVGPWLEVRTASAGAAVVDFGEAVLLPPLVNAHTHLELTHFPQWARSAGVTARATSFVDWIRQVIRVKRQVSGERFHLSVAAGIAASLAAGTGAVGDILSYFPARKAYAGTPLRGRIFLETLGQDPGTNRQVLIAIEEILRKRLVGEMTYGFAPHSPYSLSPDYLEEVFATARRHRSPLTIHLAESAAEVDFFATGTGAIAEELYPFVGWGDLVPPPAGLSPVAYLAERGGLKNGVLLAHGVQVTAAEADRLAQVGAAVVLCPRSNNRLSVGRAPVEMYRQAGVTLALGTDSRASNDSLSVWDELAFACSWFAGALDPAAWLAVATRGGAQALGLEKEMGQLTPGLGAHFQVLVPPSLPLRQDLEEFLCSPGRTAEVRFLYLAGREVLH